MKTLEELEQQIRTERRATLLVNARSRSGKRLLREALALFEERDYTVSLAAFHRNPRKFAAVMQEIMHGADPLVIVGGGDGTISSTVGYFVGTDHVLGVLPFGTGNSFARTLGIPTDDIKGALDVLTDGKIVETNLGHVGDRYFANAADIGISAVAARATSRWLKHSIGKFAYPFVALGVLLHHRPFRCRLVIDGREESFMSREVIIANGRFFGDVPVTEDASISTRELVVAAAENLSRWRFTLLWFAFALGKHEKFPDLFHATGRDIWLETDPVQVIDIDGEALEQNPAHFTVVPRALKVLVPGNAAILAAQVKG